MFARDPESTVSEDGPSCNHCESSCKLQCVRYQEDHVMLRFSDWCRVSVFSEQAGVADPVYYKPVISVNLAIAVGPVYEQRACHYQPWFCQRGVASTFDVAACSFYLWFLNSGRRSLNCKDSY